MDKSTYYLERSEHIFIGWLSIFRRTAIVMALELFKLSFHSAT